MYQYCDISVSSHLAPIVGGNVVKTNGSFNFQIALVTITGALHCGGFILTPKFAGTAGHCVDNCDPAKVNVTTHLFH